MNLKIIAGCSGLVPVPIRGLNPGLFDPEAILEHNALYYCHGLAKNLFITIVFL